jgi:hypothetical protein
MPLHADISRPANKRRTKSATGSLLSLYDGQDCVGTIKVGPRGKVVAYDAKGKRIGSFRSLQDARAAFK